MVPIYPFCIQTYNALKIYRKSLIGTISVKNPAFLDPKLRQQDNRLEKVTHLIQELVKFSLSLDYYDINQKVRNLEYIFYFPHFQNRQVF